MKKTLAALALTAMLVAGCGVETPTTGTVADNNSYDNSSGLGYSYSTGKMGIDLGGGLILDTDGNIGFGFGF